VRTWGAHRDITEREADGEKLRAAEEKYRTVADFTYDWEYWVGVDGALLYVSPACERITGYTAQEFADDPPLHRQIILEEDRDDWDRHYRESRVEHRPREMQFRIRRRDGEIRWIEHVCQPVTDAKGEFAGFRASNRDVTERKLAEEEALRAREELAHVSRVSTMGELTASLAHELNQPLAAILSNAQAARRFLAMAEPDLEEVCEALADIIEDDRRAGRVIRGLRDLLKKGDVEAEPLDVNSLVREVVALTHSDAVARNIAIRLELASDLPAVHGDRVRLQQVLLNLLLNGAEAMEHVEAEARALTVQTARHDASVVVSVRDAGVGLNEDNIDRIFDTFFTTKPGGLGMGLAICRSIVEAHGGRLWATANADRGATFQFTLPV
jgi:PAS domain S-box-containing protein